MPIPSSISDLSPTAASNSPLGSEPPTEGDNHLRALGAIVRQVYDAQADVNTDWINVTGPTYGAVGDGSTDDTTAISDAVATGDSVFLPEGTFKLTDMITCSTTGQVIQGSGKYTTIILVDAASFNMSADGVFKFTSGEPGPVIRDLTILFVQPDSATRASYNQYPPAVHAVAQPRFTIDNCRILQAWDGIDMTGNSGGASLLGLDLFSYNTGLDIDGALDSVRIDRLHWYNFNATANQITVFYDANNIGVKSARCDDLHIHDSLFIGGLGCRFYTSGSGTTFGNITNSDFDTNNGIKMESGKLNIAGCFFTMAGAGNIGFDQQGGRLTMSACEFESPAASTNGQFRQSGSVNMYATLSACRFESSGDGKVIDFTTSAGKANMTLLGCQFIAPQNSAITTAQINGGTNARLVALGNSTRDKGTGAGNFMAVSADDSHVILGNSFTGWGFSGPATMASWVAGFNDSVLSSGTATDFTSGQLTGGEKVKRFTGSLAAGAATVAHGITSAQQKGLFVQAWQKGGGGEMSAIVATVDGTNINLSGGTGTAAYRVSITYTETEQGW